MTVAGTSQTLLFLIEVDEFQKIPEIGFQQTRARKIFFKFIHSKGKNKGYIIMYVITTLCVVFRFWFWRFVCVCTTRSHYGCADFPLITQNNRGRVYLWWDICTHFYESHSRSEAIRGVQSIPQVRTCSFFSLASCNCCFHNLKLCCSDSCSQLRLRLWLTLWLTRLTLATPLRMRCVHSLVSI